MRGEGITPANRPAVSPPRLLYLMNEALFFTTHRMAIALAARAQGFEVHVAAPFDEDAVRVIRANHFTYHPIPLKRSGRILFGELYLLWTFWRLVGAIKPILTHHVAMKPVAYGGIVTRLRSVPAVVHAVTGLGYIFVHESRSARLMQAAVKVLFRLALGHPNARVIFQNPDDRAYFLNERLIDPATATIIKGTGVDLRTFAPGPEPTGQTVVMFPARLIGDKGLHEFIGAARSLQRDGVRARFVLVGRIDAINPTAVDEATVQAWQAEGLVEWWGFQPDMSTVLPQAHIVCMPSYREGLPRVLIEAAACGRPIVTADVPGCREIVRDGENGLLVAPRDIAATAVALKRLIDDPALRARMGAASRAIAIADYAVDDFIARTLAEYRTVLRRVAGAPYPV
ncbi:MAG: glycosyltransferase family 1 protein [Alphaproteobacteria bacterium]|nr:glycosyltransferase family 1 protein [Alphaproteobacteria bacterium]